MPVLDNDTSAPDETLVLRSIIVTPENGRCVIIRSRAGERISLRNKVTYVPNSGFTGIDSCVYEACDLQSQSRCDTATITFTVGTPMPPTPPTPTPPTPTLPPFTVTR